MADDQAKKNFLIKVGVGAIMSLVLIFWALNVKNIFLSSADNDTQSTSEILSLKKEFSETITSFEESLEKVDKINDDIKAASSSLLTEFILETNKTASSSETQLVISPPDTSSSSIISTSSFPTILPVAAPTQKIKLDCPSYINCMPTIGEARSCQVPPGCEEITQIAY